MSYNVQAGSGGYAGWKILERTMVKQRSAFLKSHDIRVSKDYFQKNIQNIKTAEELVNDRKLLVVVLRAFGLDSDVNNKFFLRKVIESDPADKGSLVNRLADKRYLALNQGLALHFSSEGQGARVDVGAIIEKYESRSFERNIGERHAEIELALNAQRELLNIATSDASENTKWYQILASKPLRQVFEGAYGIGTGFSSLSIDRQLSELKVRTERLTGSNSVSQFESGDGLDLVLRHFLLRSQMSVSSGSSRYANALALLRA
ncbi:DUF1217 domain-containing protein (plasmid) [Paracoccus versutus]|uniref:Uncharacterized protein DUF1217 n=1 Tax=Paracoccus versutus TaxID=34007 RepID=A0AAQ0KLJ8_PARVE|nr:MULTISPECIES: DUF1217 domain-containing protein [Paracoccus]MBT0781733.1 DUF1217 domain-containing protein [Paracoccus sp. pheM1]REG46651.1 uncharacterized protein DUF1217 [Paracoccus versutus]WEJ80911.1 DUF1217 domain-containing protein [Paracoccus versutus]